jgi:hypothetical protein
MAYPHAFGMERDGGKPEIGRRRIAEFRRCVVFDLPPGFKACSVGGASLFDNFFIKKALVICPPRFWTLHFVKHIEFHGRPSRLSRLFLFITAVLKQAMVLERPFHNAAQHHY